jgi:hypothetical protein
MNDLSGREGQRLKGDTMKMLLFAALVSAAVAVVGSASGATTPFRTFGAATVNSDGSVTASPTPGAPAGVEFLTPSNTMVGELSAVTTDYAFAAGCPTSAPELVILTVRGSILVPLRAAPGFNCGSVSTPSGNLLRPDAPADTSRIVGGTAADTWGHAKSEYDKLQVVAVRLATGTATATFANFQLAVNPRPPEPSM